MDTGYDNIEKKQERSIKEQRIREITLAYYSQVSVRKALLDFSKNRECIPRYFESFGKRPDNFEYENDILEQVKKGATSFHASEELWKDPLEISLDFSRKDFDDLRIGWDLLLDIDSPYLEYSKIYAVLLIEALELHSINNIGVKYSGSRGFHIIVPWKAFPKNIYNQKTKDMFPEWPRIICEYLGNLIQPKLAEKILKEDGIKDLAKLTGKKEEDLFIRECASCKRPATKKYLLTWICTHCKNEITTLESMYNNRRKPRCPDCRKELIEKSRKEIYSCDFCKIDSRKNPELFEKKERFAIEKLIEADLVLVAPRHLFRMPYSLHEKTALASIVIDKSKIKNFQMTDAKPFKIKLLPYYPEAKEDEAKRLLLQALDWKEEQERKGKTIDESRMKNRQSTSLEKGDLKKVVISNPTSDICPPCIRLLIDGIKQDGRKRALFILINFFKSLGVNDEELEKRIYTWNEKNALPLKKGYVMSQLNWFERNPPKMPPNCVNPMYKNLGICKPDDLCKQIKNPLTYATKKYFKK
ncbi:MAG: hypothetical protein Q8N99_00470 [Nanoarchaeota archaeon]|nr:hypothetical protein [Nanoarchaeota archaeon]